MGGESNRSGSRVKRAKPAQWGTTRATPPGRTSVTSWAPKRTRTVTVMAPVAWRTRAPSATPSTEQAAANSPAPTTARATPGSPRATSSPSPGEGPLPQEEPGQRHRHADGKGQGGDGDHLGGEDRGATGDGGVGDPDHPGAVLTGDGEHADEREGHDRDVEAAVGHGDGVDVGGPVRCRSGVEHPADDGWPEAEGQQGGHGERPQVDRTVRSLVHSARSTSAKGPREGSAGRWAPLIGCWPRRCRCRPSRL